MVHDAHDGTKKLTKTPAKVAPSGRSRTSRKKKSSYTLKLENSIWKRLRRPKPTPVPTQGDLRKAKNLVNYGSNQRFPSVRRETKGTPCFSSIDEEMLLVNVKIPELVEAHKTRLALNKLREETLARAKQAQAPTQDSQPVLTQAQQDLGAIEKRREAFELELEKEEVAEAMEKQRLKRKKERNYVDPTSLPLFESFDDKKARKAAVEAANNPYPDVHPFKSMYMGKDEQVLEREAAKPSFISRGTCKFLKSLADGYGNA
jgi:hypothetical protein